MSYQRFVAPILAHLPPETFRVVVTGDQVERGKPHPEPYLTAAAALGVPPEECLAIEDSNTGAKSAEAAGCLVLVVENHVPVLDGPRRVFRTPWRGSPSRSCGRSALHQTLDDHLDVAVEVIDPLGLQPVDARAKDRISARTARRVSPIIVTMSAKKPPMSVHVWASFTVGLLPLER